MKLKSTILVLIMLIATNSYAAWSTQISKDKMTGEISAYAFSDLVGSDEKMDFPYRNVKARVVVGCDKESEWYYFSFSDKPNLNKTDTRDGYSNIFTNIKVRNVQRVKLTQDFGSKFLHVAWYGNSLYDKDGVTFVQELIRGNNMMLELNWYGNGKTYFNFPLKGSTSAISKIRKECSN